MINQRKYDEGKKSVRDSKRETKDYVHGLNGHNKGRVYFSNALYFFSK